ncbi:MAG: carboxypeptidase regulatory-like domain-containing protein [Acidobacteria bacterium]|nr:carboxypeptidase regulatory-like domain-containing protein [Acidobacteriota bacterium]
MDLYSDTAYTGSYNLIGIIDDSSGLNSSPNIWGTASAPLDPVIGPLQNNGGPTFTRALLTGSPAQDKGNSPGVITDQRGYARPHDNASIANSGDGSDIGAYEMLAPSSTSVSISGQVLTSAGKGGQAISGVTIYLADMDGNIQTARTNPMGYYQFHDVPAGETYVVSAQHKRYRFDTKTVNANDEIADLNFAPLF